MPLKGTTEQMIKMLRKEGKPQKQAVAIALSKSREKDDMEHSEGKDSKKHERNEHIINMAIMKAKQKK